LQLNSRLPNIVDIVNFCALIQ